MIDINGKSMLKKYGIKNVFLSADFFLLIIVSIIAFIIMLILPINNKLQLLKDYSQASIAIDAGILAIVVGALAIITSLINERFLNLIQETDSYFDFVVPFYLSTLTWIASIIINFLLLVLYYFDSSKLPNYKMIVCIITSISIGLLISGLKGIRDLVITSIGLGLYRNEVLSKNEKK